MEIGGIVPGRPFEGAHQRGCPPGETGEVADIKPVRHTAYQRRGDKDRRKKTIRPFHCIVVPSRRGSLPLPPRERPSGAILNLIFDGSFVAEGLRNHPPDQSQVGQLGGFDDFVIRLFDEG